MNQFRDQTKEWYEKNYDSAKENAQRRYPNEELVRFISRNYLPIPREKRHTKKILEVGCGSCGNLWMIAREGFAATGLDLSKNAIEIGKKVLATWNVTADLIEGSMTQMHFADQSFDAVVDVIASFSLLTADFDNYIREVRRVLKPTGRFFLFALSSNSDAFKNFSPAEKVDAFTLNGIYRKDSPYYGCFYPHRFWQVSDLTAFLSERGLKTEKQELIGRTYGNLRETFEYISIDAVRQA